MARACLKMGDHHIRRQRNLYGTGTAQWVFATRICRREINSREATPCPAEDRGKFSIYVYCRADFQATGSEGRECGMSQSFGRVALSALE